MSTATKPLAMSYQLRDHTADIAVEATASDFGGLFAAIADGLAAAMCESIPGDGGDRFTVECHAESREALLYEYLDQLIYERDVRMVLPVDNEADIMRVDGEADTKQVDGEADTKRVDGETDMDADSQTDDTEWVVTASARGIPLEEVTARDIKAVTYSEMDVDQRPDGWYGYVVFDV